MFSMHCYDGLVVQDHTGLSSKADRMILPFLAVERRGGPLLYISNVPLFKVLVAATAVFDFGRLLFFVRDIQRLSKGGAGPKFPTGGTSLVSFDRGPPPHPLFPFIVCCTHVCLFLQNKIKI